MDSLRSGSYTMEDLKTVSCSEQKMTEAKSNGCLNNDFLLKDEKFDFDLSLSPASENEDEVFVGPIIHKEKCIAVSLESHEGPKDKISPLALDAPAWSPLAGEKFVEIFKEAHLVALQLQSASKTKRKKSGEEETKTETVDKFVQESKSKLKILERGIVMNKSPNSVKRETYCVVESPVSQESSSFQKCSMQPLSVTEDSHCPQRLLKASSPAQLNKLPKASVMHLSQSKSDKNIKKPSTFQTVKSSSTSGNNSNLPMGQPRQGRLSSSSSRNNVNSTGSSEELLSDKSSIASDGDLPFCSSSSAQENQTVPTPSKLGVKTRQLKAPSNVHMRRIASSSSTSSFSSMNSSFNSNLSLSPKIGKVQTSGGVAKAFANRSSLSSTPSKISTVRSMKMSLVQTSHTDTSGNRQKAASATKENSSVNVPKYKAAVMCETSGSGIQKAGSEPSQKLLQKSMLGNIRISSSPKLKSKTMSPVPKEDMSSKNAAGRVLQPVKLSCANAGSNVAVTSPLKQSEERRLSKSCSAVKSALQTPSSSVRHSSVPTPVGRRVSGIPTLTPQTVPRSMASNSRPLRQVSSVSHKKPLVTSSKEAKDSKTRGATSSSSSTEEDSSILYVIPIALDFSPEKNSEELEQQVTKKEEPAKESLLIDIGLDKTPIRVDKIVIQKCDNKPLIDLFNTPENIKSTPVKPTGQLIDLSSPLIQLGPEGNKENIDSPLLKF